MVEPKSTVFVRLTIPNHLYINVNLYKELYPYVLSIQKTQETAPEGAALMKGYVTAIWKLAV